MGELLAHRGPDGEGWWVDGPVGLVHRRLAIVDLSEAAAQPMTTADGRLRIAYNGEIYNFPALRRALEARGARFRTRSDTEVLLAAYRAWGLACLDRLRGMFAFALWDAEARRLLLARDRIGKKPLYYHLDADGLAFASEPKAFLADPAWRPEVDLGAGGGHGGRGRRELGVQELLGAHRHIVSASGSSNWAMRPRWREASLGRWEPVPWAPWSPRSSCSPPAPTARTRRRPPTRRRPMLR